MPNAPWHSILVRVLSIWQWVKTWENTGRECKLPISINPTVFWLRDHSAEHWNTSLFWYMIYRNRIYTTTRRKTIQLCRNIYNYISSSKHAPLYTIKKPFRLRIRNQWGGVCVCVWQRGNYEVRWEDDEWRAIKWVPGVQLHSRWGQSQTRWSAMMADRWHGNGEREMIG